MIQWVWERARAAKKITRLLVATDDKRIVDAVAKFGGEAVMTDPELPSGTDRVWAAAAGTKAEIILNIQGDEPLLPTKGLDTLVEGMRAGSSIRMGTLAVPMKSPQGFSERNTVKVVSDLEGWALYFSRSPLPGSKDGESVPAVWYKHIGIYGYRRELLQQFVRWEPSALEKAEGLEQLRALEHGVRIRVFDSPSDTMGVDTPDDVKRVERLLR